MVMNRHSPLRHLILALIAVSLFSCGSASSAKLSSSAPSSTTASTEGSTIGESQTTEEGQEKTMASASMEPDTTDYSERDFYVVGEFNGWQDEAVKDERYKMSWDGDRLYALAIPIRSGEEFKLFGPKTATAGQVLWIPQGWTNLSVEEDGIYDISYYPWTRDIYVERVGEYVEWDPYVEELPVDSSHALWVLGSHNGGTEGKKHPDQYRMKQTNLYYHIEDVYLPRYTRFRLVGYTSDDSYWVAQSWIVVTQEGYYDIVYYPDGLPEKYEGTAYSENTALKLTRASTDYRPGYFIVGTFCNWAINERAIRINDIPESGGNAYGTYYAEEFVLEEAAEFKILSTAGKWYPEGSNNNYSISAGRNTLYFDPNCGFNSPRYPNYGGYVTYYTIQ